MFTVKKTEWKEKKEEFKLKGKTPDNGTILVLNAVDRSLIAEIEPSHDHFSLRTTIQGGLGVPCTVIVEQGNNAQEVSVEDAPANCGRKLTIAGQVVAAPIPFAIVQFTIGSQVFQRWLMSMGSIKLMSPRQFLMIW